MVRNAGFRIKSQLIRMLHAACCAALLTGQRAERISHRSYGLVWRELAELWRAHHGSHTAQLRGPHVSPTRDKTIPDQRDPGRLQRGPAHHNSLSTTGHHQEPVSPLRTYSLFIRSSRGSFRRLPTLGVASFRLLATFLQPSRTRSVVTAIALSLLAHSVFRVAFHSPFATPSHTHSLSAVFPHVVSWVISHTVPYDSHRIVGLFLAHSLFSGSIPFAFRNPFVHAFAFGSLPACVPLHTVLRNSLRLLSFRTQPL